MAIVLSPMIRSLLDRCNLQADFLYVYADADNDPHPEMAYGYYGA